ncbi:MAG: hypothetical protein AAF197_10055 [Pseudomonadota bacterium]
MSKTDAYSLLLNAVSPGEEALDADEQDLDDDNLDDELDGTEKNELLQGQVDECFRQIEYRVAAFGDHYPFVLEQGSLSLKQNLTAHQQFYLILLAASRTRTFNSITGFKQRLADVFEAQSLFCLKQMLPDEADVVSFGPTSEDRQQRFGSNLLDALPRLAKLMGVEMTNGWDQDLSPQGDAGIDLVGVQKLDTSQGGWNVFLAQCAAHEEASSWSKKRAEAKLSFYHYLFSYSVESQGVLFIPGCFRQANGKWAQRRYTDGVIVMDRLRLMRIISDCDNLPDAFEEFFDQNLAA